MADQVQELEPQTVLGTVQPVDAMLDLVASLVGAPDDPELRNLALRYLDRAADRMNQAGVLLFQRKEKTYVSGTDYDDGDTFVSLPADYGWGTDSVRAQDASSQLVSLIEWIPWHRFKPLFDRGPTSVGISEYCSLLNEFDDRLYFYPGIRSSLVPRIVVPYFARLQRPSEVSDATLLLTPEAREALVTGGEAMMIRYRYVNSPNIWQPFMADFERALARARGASARLQMTAHHAWAIPDEQGRLVASAYDITPTRTLTITL